MRTRDTVVYDPVCGPCATFKGAVGFLDPRGRIGFLSIEEAEGNGVLDCVPAPMRRSSFHLVTPEGTVQSGARALPDLARQLPLGLVASAFMASAPGGPTNGRLGVLGAFTAPQ